MNSCCLFYIRGYLKQQQFSDRNDIHIIYQGSTWQLMLLNMLVTFVHWLLKKLTGKSKKKVLSASKPSKDNQGSPAHCQISFLLIFIQIG